MQKEVPTLGNLNKIINITETSDGKYVVSINKDVSVVFNNLEIISDLISIDGNAISLNGRTGYLLKDHPLSKKYLDYVNNQDIHKEITLEQNSECYNDDDDDKIIYNVLSELEEKILGTHRIKNIILRDQYERSDTEICSHANRS